MLDISFPPKEEDTSNGVAPKLGVEASIEHELKYRVSANNTDARPVKLYQSGGQRPKHNHRCTQTTLEVAAAACRQPLPPFPPVLAVAWSVHDRLVDAFDQTQAYWK
jgi:hypothetical protein